MTVPELGCARAAELKHSGLRYLHPLLAIDVKGRGVSAAPLIGDFAPHPQAQMICGYSICAGGLSSNSI